VIGADVNQRDERPHHKRLPASVDSHAPTPQQHERSNEQRAPNPAQRDERLREASGLPTMPEQPDVKENKDEPCCDEERGNTAGGDARHRVQITPELVLPQVTDG
jgi:hypothetical protein